MPDAFYNAMVLREPYSGVEVTVHQLACALAQFGSLPLCLCLPPGQRPVPVAPHVRLRLSQAGRTRIGRILWEQTVLPVLLRRAQAPLLHAPAYVAPLAAPCPVVLTVHDLHALTHPRFCGVANRLHYRLALPPSLRRAAAIIVFSAHTRRTVLERFPEAAGRLVTVPPGLAPHFAPVSDRAALEALRRRHSLPQRFLLFVGDLTRRKNVSGLIDGFASLARPYPALGLVLAGHADAPSAARLDAHVQEAGLSGRVSRIGYVPDAELPALYSLAEAFVFPSHDEGFGLPPLEAMACGCPVVCSGGAAPENCGAAALTCDPCDPASIARAISLLLDRPEERTSRVAAGLRRAADFSWRRAAQATEAVYRAVLARTPLPVNEGV